MTTTTTKEPTTMLALIVLTLMVAIIHSNILNVANALLAAD